MLNNRKILKAAALAYSGNAPHLKAFGKGDSAKAIIELAKKYNVKIYEKESDDLLEALADVRVNTEIPPELYLAIARIYALFYYTDERQESINEKNSR